MSTVQRYSRHSPPRYEHGVAPDVEVIFRDAKTLTDGERAAKRRRIEAHAENYLRGGEIHIQSAALRGPFEGWKNPWRSDGGMVEEKELRLSPKSGTKVSDKKVLSTENVRSSHFVERKKDLVVEFKDIKKTAVEEHAQKTTETAVPISTLDRLRKSKYTQRKTPRTEKWLKTIDKDLMSDLVDLEGSPMDTTAQTPTRSTRRNTRHRPRRKRTINELDFFLHPARALKVALNPSKLEISTTKPRSEISPLSSPLSSTRSSPPSSPEILAKASYPQAPPLQLDELLDERVVETHHLVSEVLIEMTARSLGHLSALDDANGYDHIHNEHTEGEFVKDALDNWLQMSVDDDDVQESAPEEYRGTNTLEHAMS